MLVLVPVLVLILTMTTRLLVYLLLPPPPPPLPETIVYSQNQGPWRTTIKENLTTGEMRVRTMR